MAEKMIYFNREYIMLKGNLCNPISPLLLQGKSIRKHTMYLACTFS